MKHQSSNKKILAGFAGRAGICAVLLSGQSAYAAVTSVTGTSCNSRLDVTVASSTRSSAVSALDCQERTLDTASGFALASSAPTGSTTPDSSAMVSAGGELYEAFVGAAREAAVLLTPNRALMMSRDIAGDRVGVDWNMGLAVQPVSGATNAWLTGTYTLLRANRETKIVDTVNQTDAELSEVFDPVTLRITFDGNSGCSIASYSSWLSYSLTTDPAGAFGQPDGDDYGLHQAVYAGEGYAGSGGVHEDSVRTFTDCDYVLASDGKLLVTYDYTDGDAVAHSAENSYFVSADLRYLVSTVDAGVDLYRGFEIGVRVKAISGTQDERNDGVAGTYLFNAPTLELQGATGVLSEPDNEHRNGEKSAQCMSRGSAVLSTTSSATSGWNTCTWDMTSTCSVRGEEGETPTIAVQHYTAQRSDTAATCRFQISANGSADFVVNLDTAEGAQNVTFSGAVADNNEGLVLRGKYIGTAMTNPSDTNPPERQIKNDLVLSALVGIKYGGTLTADADADGLNNLGEFVYADFLRGSKSLNFNGDAYADILFRNEATKEMRSWTMDGSNLYTAISFFPQYSIGNDNWQVVALGDIDSDGDTDVVWRNVASGYNRSWIMEKRPNGQEVFRETLTFFPQFGSTEWSIKGMGDSNNDGTEDLYFYNSTTGQLRIWEMDTAGNRQTVYFPGSQTVGYQLQAVGDFDGDGDGDVFWRDPVNGLNQVWEMQNGAKLGAAKVLPTFIGTTWNVAGAGDLDGNNIDDLIWINSSNQTQRFWEMAANNRAAEYLTAKHDATEIFAGTADYDGDGVDDITYYDSTTGFPRIWWISEFVKAGSIKTPAFGAGGSWKVIGDKDS